MNFWTLISTIIISLGLTTSSFYHLPTITLVNNQQAILNQEILAEQEFIPHKVDNSSLGVKISAQAAAVMDESTGIILWQKNAEEIRSIASLTKLMTALVFLDNNPGWQAQVELKSEDETNAGTANILRGETVLVKDLFYTSLIASDNDAINALVRSTGLGKEEFVKLMNQKAKELKLKNTSFVDPTGLEANNRSTVLDLLKLAKISFANQDIQDAVQQMVYNFTAVDGKAHKIFSTNQLLDSYLDITAGKTGYISQSGYCLVVEVDLDNGHHILSIVLGSDTHQSRFQDAKILSAWVLDNFIWS